MKTKLSKILFEKGWTEMELSRRTGIAQSYINRVKNARVMPTVRTALRICRALDVPVEEAFVYEDKPYGVTPGAWFPTADACVAEPRGAGDAAGLAEAGVGGALGDPISEGAR